MSAAAAAQPTTTSLRAHARSLRDRTHSALLDLYALDSRLHAVRTQLTSLEARASELRREQLLLEQQLAATRTTLTISQRRLGANLSMLYKEGDVNSLTVMLGSTSLSDAIARLDDLNSVADESKQYVAAAINAQTRLKTLRTSVKRRRAELDAAVVRARATTSSLEAARAERVGFIAGLRREQRLNTARIHTLEDAARRVERKSATLQAAAAPAPVASDAAPDAASSPALYSPPASTATSGSTITVTATGYSMGGRTATGMPAGWGVVAVDPAVIPLGTRLTIPGYGDAVAADTGGAVRGDSIDLWFPTLAQALAWGRRTVTVTLH